MENLWGNLECPACNGTEFISVVNMRWKPAGGIVIVPSGKYVCAKCSLFTQPTDGEKLINHAKSKLKLQKLKEISADIDSI